MNYIKRVQDTGENKDNIEQQAYNTFSKLYDLFAGDVSNGGENKLQASRWIYNDDGDQYPTLHYINLGIRQMVKPQFTISQNISYALLNVNGYSYKYTYGNKGDATIYPADDTTRPTVKWQSKTDITAFSREIYPSDLPKDPVVNTSLQIVYKIDITNTNEYDVDGIYKEHKMFVNSLTNTYDASRYNLVKEITIDGIKYTWNDSTVIDTTKFDETTRYSLKEGKTTLNLDETKVFEDGIEKGKSKYAYIAFDVTKEALLELLNHPNGIIEDLPTTATAEVYHEYTRYDYGWKQSEYDIDKSYSRQEFRYWSIDNKDTGGNEVTGKEGKIHYTIPESRKDSAPYLALRLYGGTEPVNRTISGTVFIDNNVRAEANEVVGNGIYDETEENRVSGVTIELLQKSNNEIANLYTIEKVVNFEGKTTGYKFKDPQQAKVDHTDTNGRYEFVGVVPGEYYVRFTYGNGEQKIYDTNGEEVKNDDGTQKSIYSNGYKSTIVRDSRAKSAYNGYTPDGRKISALEEPNKNYLWYLYTTDTIYNSAFDNDINNESFEYEQQIDFRTQNTDKNYVAKSKRADTPFISVPIEFTTKKEGSEKEHYSSFDKMSFGIIEKPKIKINIKKEITNVKLTLQNGQVLLNGNPGTQNIRYVANLDEIWSNTGSSYTKIETDNQYMYGSTLEITYSLTAENNSERTFTTENYYKYGEIPTERDGSIDTGKEAKVYVNTLLEYLDPSLKIKLFSDIKTGTGDTEYTYNESGDNKKIDKINDLEGMATSTDSPYLIARNTLETNENVEPKKYYNTVYQLGKTDYTYKLNSKSLSPAKNSETDESSTTVKVVAQRILSNENDDLDYTSFAQVSQITTAINAYSDPTAAPFVSVGGEDEWGTTKSYDEPPEDSSKITITPSTGLDRSMKYIISATIVSITLGAIVICIKKTMK